MKFIIEALNQMPEYRQLSKAVSGGATPAIITGVSAIHKSAVAYALSNTLNKKVLFLCAEEGECNKVYDDLCSMGLSASTYPLRDFSLRDTAVSSHEYERKRLEALNRLMSGNSNCIVASIDAALQFTIPKDELVSRGLKISAGQEITQAEILRGLTICGYQRAEQIDGIGQFSHRGGLIDFYPPGTDNPIRIEFWGDEIDSISVFDTETQRRGESLENITITPAVEVIPRSIPALIKKIMHHRDSLRGKAAVKAKEILDLECKKLENGVHVGSIDKFISFIYEKNTTLFDYFSPENSLLFFSEGNNLKEKIRTTLWQWGEDIKDLLAEGVLCRELDKFSEDWVYALGQAEKIPTLLLDNFARGTYEIPAKTLLNINVKQLSAWGGSTQLLKEDLDSSIYRNLRCVVLAGTERAAQNVAADLKSQGIPAGYFDHISTVSKGTVAVLAGTLSAGFELPGAEFSLITHGRITASAKSTSKKKDKNKKDIYSLAELTPGDYVVHNTHGIGVFQGIHKIETQGILKDYIKIQYAKNDVLYVPVTQLDTVAKYIGPRDDGIVKLHRLGGVEWQKAKSRVRTAVKDIAKGLIALYAQRMELKGFSFPEDDEWQRDFEAHFDYDETDDQLRCIEEIKADMENHTPMDRLLCGDVGFGKTEVALRAAFKCITAGKQCAILVPTTILAWQHYQTILKRMEGFPISVELLSRFRNSKQQDEVLRKLKRGTVDLVVGTHRLVSKDVEFRDLGLVVIDEEQRFGVAQKERLKEACKTADILTLSATPIPRTLNMALSGIRDMSVIEEAPHDRHPVQTYVLEHDMGVIADAIRKEIRRGGQIYYLHNDVASISSTAAKILAKVPEARIGIGHGKMSEQELSEVWRQLMEHEIDVLVCTTIIETGVDVSNANTLVIDNADRMGLSQLHQIRGRVGRSNRRAYAYFTFAPNKVLTEIAQKRLSAIREFTEFGSGFKIAMRDLEIRGAGNVLGGEQHGHMESVGYDMYLKLLNEAVAIMKGEEPPAPDKECSVDMNVQAHIPENYISSVNLRLEAYRRIADIRTYDDSIDVVDELIDRYGEPPEAVKGLIDIALLRNMAAAMDITEVKQRNESIMLYLDKIDMEKISKLIGKMKGRILLSAAGSPYITVKLNNQEPLTVLEEALHAMQGDTVTV